MNAIVLQLYMKVLIYCILYIDLVLVLYTTYSVEPLHCIVCYSIGISTI